MGTPKAERYSSPWLVAALLGVCIFAPYGTFSLGGGSLRLDHLVVPAVFAYVVLRGRLQLWPPLLIGLLAFAGLAVLSSIVSLETFLRDPLTAMKNFDGIMRGPFILAIALTIRPSQLSARVVLRTFVIIAVVLMILGVLDRVLPAENPIIALLIRLYGGPAEPTIGINHKHLMLLESRATAVFFTPPSLSMVSLFFIAAGMTRGAPISMLDRGILIVSGVIAGVASNSKSFILGVGTLVILIVAQRQAFGERLRNAGLLAAAVIVPLLLSSQLAPQLTFNPLSHLDEAENLTSRLTGGRFGEDEWDANRVALRVLDDAPFLGYGLGEEPGVIYSDSGLNKLLLHAGLMGVLMTFVGCCAQLAWFARRHRWGWARLGFQVLALALALFLAGPIFMMARVNDVLFSILGIAIAFSVPARREQANAATVAILTPPRAPRPTSVRTAG